jgi:hypothetical protein
MNRRLTLWLATWLLTAAVRAAPVSSAELFYMDHDLLTSKFVGPVGPLVISGDIEPGDYERLLGKIHADDMRFLSQNKVIVASNGGDVREAIKIALLLQSLYSQVTVGPQTGPCSGACFLIYAAADQRASDGEHLIGLHRPALVDALSSSLSAADATALEARAMTEVRAFLVTNEVPSELQEEMFRRSADEVYWLSDADEKALGFRSPSFLRYLKAHCAWDDAVEREALAGKRPFADLGSLQACEARVTQADARKALAAALKAAGLKNAAP